MAQEMYGKTPSWFAEQAKILQSQGGKGYYEDVLKANKMGPFSPKVAAPTATGITQTEQNAGWDAYQKSLPSSDVMSENYLAPKIDTPSTFNASNPNPDSVYGQVGDGQDDWYNPADWGRDFSKQGQVMPGYDPVTGNYSDSQFNVDQKQLLQQSEIDKNNAIMNNQGTSWNDWANIGLGTVGTAMEIGMYGDKKDFLSNSNKALEQSTANAEEAHNTKLANNASYGSAFSNNA